MRWKLIVAGLVLGGIMGGFLTRVDWSFDPMGPWVTKVTGIGIGAVAGLIVGAVAAVLASGAKKP
jgi:hypothetical protein